MAAIDFASFCSDVYEVVASVPYGKVVTYGQVAWLVGMPRHSRLVGRVLHVAAHQCIPCHRVVNSHGRTCPHWEGQRALLEAEGVIFKSNGCVDMKTCGWDMML